MTLGYVWRMNKSLDRGSLKSMIPLIRAVGSALRTTQRPRDGVYYFCIRFDSWWHWYNGVAYFYPLSGSAIRGIEPNTVPHQHHSLRKLDAFYYRV